MAQRIVETTAHTWLCATLALVATSCTRATETPSTRPESPVTVSVAETPDAAVEPVVQADPPAPVPVPDAAAASHGATCVGGGKVRSASGEITSCLEYVCRDGACLRSCTTQDDCSGARPGEDVAIHGWPFDCYNSKCVPYPPWEVVGPRSKRSTP